MIEYTIKEDTNNILACFISGIYTMEVNITGMTDETEIQNKLSSALEQARELNSGEG